MLFEVVEDRNPENQNADSRRGSCRGIVESHLEKELIKSGLGRSIQ